MKTTTKLTLVFLALLIAQSINAQPLDTLKIKAEADSLKTVADSLRKAWQLDEALEIYQTALKNYQNIGYRENEAKALKGIGTVFYYQGNAQEALPYWEKELAIYHVLNNRLGEGNTLNNIGIVYMYLSDYPNALEYYQRSLKIKRELGDRSSEGGTLNNIGLVYKELSDYPKALEYFEQDLEICRELDDRRGEGQSLNNIGMVYANLSDYPKALEYYEKSLEIKREVGDRSGVGMTLQNIGLVYYDISNYPKALEYSQQSLEILREVGDRKVEGMILNNIGLVYYELPDYPKALEYFDRSLEIKREIGDHKGEGYTLNSIGIVYSKQEKYIEAEEYIQHALSIALELKTESKIKLAYSALGNCYAEQGLDSLAVENYAKSIETVESIRGKLEIEAQKSSYSAGLSETYEKMVLALLRIDRDEEAYNYIERGRARSFLDLLASGKVKVGKSRHEEFLRDEEESQEEIEEMEEQLIAAAEDTTQLLALRGKLEEKRGFITANIEEKKQYEPELASMVMVNSLTLPEVQELLDGKSTILEYFLTEEKTLIWLITRDEAEVFQVEVGGDSLKKKVENFRGAIMNLEDAERLSGELYDILIAPAAGKIKTENLVIIPHGILHYLPFHALQDEKGNYMVDRYRIRYLPSASVMKYLIPKIREKGTKLLAFGNPKTDRVGYPPIPFSEGEVKEIAGLYRDSNVLIGAEATEDVFRKSAADYDILHLACHGELNSAFPLFSGLLLAPGDEQDGELDVHELFTMDLNAYLVVLSACQTGLGHLTNGDELVGLSRAFIYAGTPSIVSSLWMVEDESTAYLILLCQVGPLKLILDNLKVLLHNGQYPILSNIALCIMILIVGKGRGGKIAPKAL